MAEARYLLKPGMDGYGPVCPLCASPKHRQSRRCAACYYDARRRHEYPDPPWWLRTNLQTKPRVKTGRSSGRPQPQSHPWRAKNKLLFRNAA